MKRRTERRPIRSLALASVLVLGFATLGIAEDRRASLPLEDVIADVDPVGGTITLGERVYSVDGGVALFDVGGRPIGLRELAVEGIGRLAEYQLGGRGVAGGDLSRLQVMDGDYE